MTILPQQPPPEKPRAKLIAPPARCPKCRDELTVYARGRQFCVRCDAVELFGELGDVEEGEALQ